MRYILPPLNTVNLLDKCLTEWITSVSVNHHRLAHTEICAGHTHRLEVKPNTAAWWEVRRAEDKRLSRVPVGGFLNHMVSAIEV